MTPPRQRQSNRAHPVITHSVFARPGNKNAKRRNPTQLVLYKATVELHGLLERGPVLRCKAIAYLRQRGIGFHTAQAAAALIGVPPIPANGEWKFPHPIPLLPALLDHIVQNGRHVGKEARHQRGLYSKDPDYQWNTYGGRG